MARPTMIPTTQPIVNPISKRAALANKCSNSTPDAMRFPAVWMTRGTEGMSTGGNNALDASNCHTPVTTAKGRINSNVSARRRLSAGLGVGSAAVNMLHPHSSVQGLFGKCGNKIGQARQLPLLLHEFRLFADITEEAGREQNGVWFGVEAPHDSKDDLAG